jgi:hypothetical protein
MAEMKFPLLAVAGEPKSLRPTTNKIADII